MKLHLRVLASISLAFLFSCSNNELGDEYFVGGKIDNGSDSLIYLYKKPDVISSFLGQNPNPADTITTDAKGLFLSSTKYDSGLYYLRYQNVELPLFLLPGKKLNINFDVQDPAKSLEFSGSLKHPNRLIRDRNKKIRSVQEEAAGKLSAGEEEYLAFLDSARKSLDTLVVQFITNHPRTDRNFLQYQQEYTFYTIGNLLLDYTNRLERNGDTLSAKMQKALTSFPVNRDQTTGNPRYLSYAYRYSKRFTDELDESEQRDSLVFRTVDSVLTTSKTKSIVGMRYALEVLDRKGSIPEQGVLNSMNSLISHRDVRKILDKELEAYSRLSSGVSAPSVTLQSITGEEVSLAQFKGAPLLIYAGTADCGQCKQMFEDSADLKNQFEDLQLLGVGTGRDREVWKSYIEKHELPGTQLFDHSGEFTRHFKVRSVPRLILLDAAGNITQSKSENPEEDLRNYFAEIKV